MKYWFNNWRLGWVIVCGAALLLSACGFQLRKTPNYSFNTIAIESNGANDLVGQLTPYLGDRIRPLISPKGVPPPQVALIIHRFSQDKTVIGWGLAGQVRNYLLQSTVVFSVKNAQGDTLLDDVTLSQRRGISYNETQALAKGAEEVLLDQDMLQELALQLSHRLQAIKLLN